MRFAVAQRHDVVAIERGAGALRGGVEPFHLYIDFYGHKLGKLHVAHFKGGRCAAQGDDHSGVLLGVGVGGERADVGLGTGGNSQHKSRQKGKKATWGHCLNVLLFECLIFTFLNQNYL